jgi:hypothetical protein
LTCSSGEIPIPLSITSIRKNPSCHSFSVYNDGVTKDFVLLYVDFKFLKLKSPRDLFESFFGLFCKSIGGDGEALDLRGKLFC